MKKIVYLCIMMMLSMNMMAQIDPYDRNWDTIVFDDFNETNRQFNNTFQEPLGRWLSFVPNMWPSGVTKNNKSHQIYQWNHCVFDGTNSRLRLNSEYIRSTPILCNEQPNFYDIPPTTYGISYHCNPNHLYLYYYSGVIESPPSETKTRSDNLPEPRFLYGFFEIRCQLPVHNGAFPAFWLWDSMKDQFYEEIDIFEVSKYFVDSSMVQWTHNPNPQGITDISTFTTGLYYNGSGSSIGRPTSQARNYPSVQPNTDLTDWHTFSCEWMPEHVIWYCDGSVVNEYHNTDSIPRHPLTLKANYGIDRYALQGFENAGVPVWQGNDSMVIDYIKVLQLNWDCETDETIRQQSELDNFDFGVKNSVNVTSSLGNVCVDYTCKVTFRVTDSFEITGGFLVEPGGEMTIYTQKCPE